MNDKKREPTKQGDCKGANRTAQSGIQPEYIPYIHNK